MCSKTQATNTAHPAISLPRSAKGRIALIAMATGALSFAGMGGAAATAQAQPAIPQEILHGSSTLAAHGVEIPAVSSSQIPGLSDAVTQVAGGTQATSGSVVKPAEGTFTSGYGARWGTTHYGVDIANSIGTPILAVMDGTVINSGPASGYGNWIRIQHDDGSMSVYGHMSTLNVSVGERVTAGQQIAGMGSEGFSTGSHLHFEIHPSGNGAVDPVPWFAQHGIFL